VKSTNISEKERIIEPLPLMFFFKIKLLKTFHEKLFVPEKLIIIISFPKSEHEFHFF
jgi:hypothetical protein